MNHALAQVGLRVPDLAASVEHVLELRGLEEVDRDERMSRLAFPDRPVCLVLIEDDSASCDHMGLRTSEENVTEIRDRAEAAGLAIDDGTYLAGAAFRLFAPNG